METTTTTQAEATTVELEDEGISECPVCGSTELVEISDEFQSINICAECGAD
jgi:ribosomal protein L37AE/L43A